MANFFNILAHCLILTFLGTCVTANDNDSNKFLRSITKWAMKKSSSLLPDTMGWLFPPGSKLVLDPMLEVPVLKSVTLGVGSVFKMSFPLTIMLDSLSMKHWDDITNVHRNWALLPLNGDFNTFNRYKRSYANESANTTSVPLCSSLSLERAVIFKKIENILDSYGLSSGLGIKNNSGKSCLLRSICEIHQFQLTKKFGIMGELITHFVSLNKLSEGCEEDNSSMLKDYITAEMNGVKGQCQKYYKRCNNTFFIN